MDRATLELTKVIAENVLYKQFDFTDDQLKRFKDEFNFELKLSAEKIFYHFGEVTPFERQKQNSINRESFEEISHIQSRN